MNDSEYNNLCAHGNELMHALHDRMKMQDAWHQENAPGWGINDPRWDGPEGDALYAEVEQMFNVNAMEEKLREVRDAVEAFGGEK